MKRYVPMVEIIIDAERSLGYSAYTIKNRPMKLFNFCFALCILHCFYFRFFLLSTRYATANMPAMANTAPNHGGVGVGLGVGVATVGAPR